MNKARLQGSRCACTCFIPQSQLSEFPSPCQRQETIGRTRAGPVLGHSLVKTLATTEFRMDMSWMNWKPETQRCIEPSGTCFDFFRFDPKQKRQHRALHYCHTYQRRQVAIKHVTLKRLVVRVTNASGRKYLIPAATTQARTELGRQMEASHPAHKRQGKVGNLVGTNERQMPKDDGHQHPDRETISKWRTKVLSKELLEEYDGSHTSYYSLYRCLLHGCFTLCLWLKMQKG